MSIAKEIKLTYDKNYCSRVTMYLGVRRALELLLILALSPLILLLTIFVSIAVLIDQKGKLFFLQERIGFKNNTFKIIKFRTMRTCINDCNSLATNQSDITAIGKFLRKHRLDEIPQFLNIINGDMSIIGPRPNPMYYNNIIYKYMPEYELRHLIKPGLTGYAQVNYKYSDTLEDEIVKFNYDINYLNSISFRTDFIILLKTIPVVIFGIGAK